MLASQALIGANGTLSDMKMEEAASCEVGNAEWWVFLCSFVFVCFFFFTRRTEAHHLLINFLAKVD